MKIVGFDGVRCPKCGISLKDVSFESIKERHLAVLLAEKRRKELEETYRDIKRNGDGFVVEDCDLCGAVADDICKQIRIDLGKV